MKFIEEQDVPERVRLVNPGPSKTLENILRAITTILERETAPAEPLDLDPLVQAIREIPSPPTPPEFPSFPAPAKSWTFKIVRNDFGQIEEVIAKRQV